MRVKRREASPLQKFKDQTLITKKFGKKALLVYNAIPTSQTIDEREIENEVGIKGEELKKILEFMLEKGMIKEEKDEIEIEEKYEEKEEKAGVREEPQEKTEIVEVSKKPPEKRNEVGEKKREGVKAEEAKGIEKEVEEKEEIEIKPIQVPLKGEKEETFDTKEIKSETEGPKEKPIEKEEEIEKVEISPVGLTQEKIKGDEEEKNEEIDLKNLSPLEAEMYANYGKEGVIVYRKVKEGLTEAEILQEVKGDEVKIKGAINTLKELGYISKREEKKEEEREKFSPMMDYGEETPLEIEEKDKIKYIKEIRGGFLFKTKESIKCKLKFKECGKVFNSLKKGADLIELLKTTKVPLSTLERILEFLEKEKLIELSYYNREEIKEKFGEDSYIMYKKYGKKGLVFYELIGEDMKLKEIATLLEIKDKEKVFEILSFIHELLNINVPLDKELIMKKLE